MQSRTPPHRMVPPTFRMGIPTLFNLTQITSHRHGLETCLCGGSRSWQVNNINHQACTKPVLLHWAVSPAFRKHSCLTYALPTQWPQLLTHPAVRAKSSAPWFKHGHTAGVKARSGWDCWKRTDVMTDGSGQVTLAGPMAGGRQTDTSRRVWI